MGVPSFGFSVGDFISIISLVQKVDIAKTESLRNINS